MIDRIQNENHPKHTNFPQPQSELHLAIFFPITFAQNAKQKLQIREVEGAPAAACKVMNKPNQINPTQFLFTSNYTTHPQRMHKTQTMHQS
jgi:hypothetical protein